MMAASRNNPVSSPVGSQTRLRRSATPVLNEEDWIQLYTSRILRAWFHQEAPLGLAWTYANWIRRDLAQCYAKPLRRAFIEETYRVTIDKPV
jgi:hypothetical protein